MSLLVEAQDAAEEVLRDFFGINVTKALDPTHPKDFLVITDRLAKSMRGVTDPHEQRAVKRALEALDVDWKGMSAGGRAKVIAAADRALATELAKGLPKLDAVLDTESGNVVEAARNATIRRFRLKLSPDLNRTDERIASFVSSSQGNFVRDEYGRRRAGFSEKARRIAESGAERGLGSDDIAEEMNRKLPMSVLGQSEAYSQILAMSFVNRARTTTQLSAFEEASIERFMIDAVLDEATSSICRFLHGKTFSTGKALARFRAADDAEDPEDIKRLQPWLTTSTNDDGQETLLFRKGEKHEHVATVTESGVGTSDDVGSYSGGMEDDALEENGITAPPFHGHCRTTIIPDM